MTLKKSHSLGFSLIELMIVFAIVSLIAAVIVPRFLKHQIQQKHLSCEKNLRSLYQAEKDFFEKHQKYSQDTTELGWQIQGKAWHQYHFTLPPPQNGFVFECVGNLDDDPALDRSTIDEKGTIDIIRDDSKE